MKYRCATASTIAALGLVVFGAASIARAADLVVPKGTTLLVRTRQTIDTRRMSPGAKFTLNLEQNLEVDGQVVAPDGSTVYGTIASAKKSGRMLGQAEATLALTQIKVKGKLLPIRTSGVKAAGAKKGRQAARKAAGGALIGAMFGGGKGAAMGAAAGASAQLVLGGDQIQVPANTLLEFTLADPLVIQRDPPKAAAKPSSAGGSDPLELALAVAKTRNANAEAIQSYNWQQRTELKHKGKTILVRLELLRFDGDGEIQRTTISDDSAKAGTKAEILDDIQELRPYALPTAGDLVDFMQNATVDTGGDRIVAMAKGVHQNEDQIRLSIRKSDKSLARIEVQTKLKGQPVEATIEYKTLKKGPNHPYEAKVSIPSQGVEVILENFNFNAE